MRIQQINPLGAVVLAGYSASKDLPESQLLGTKRVFKTQQL